MNRFVFRKTEADDFQDMKPGEYRRFTSSNGPGAILCCPTCKRTTAAVNERWTISPKGDVMPSVDHSPAGCSFHEFITLEGWEP